MKTFNFDIRGKIKANTRETVRERIKTAMIEGDIKDYSIYELIEDNPRCKDCNMELTDRNKYRWTQKFLDSCLCLGCYRIKESEDDPKSTEHLDIKDYKKEREIRRKENA